jgi:predicted P-loop ATPase
MTRPDLSRVKAFTSRQVDRIRPPYGRRTVQFRRECIFAGSTNKEDYLKDETGGRRWWPVRCGLINNDDLRRDRDQLWAEAVVCFRAGETWWLDSNYLIEADTDPWQPIIKQWISERDCVTVDQILDKCIEKPAKDWSQVDKNRVARSWKACTGNDIRSGSIFYGSDKTRQGVTTPQAPPPEVV